MKKARRLFNRLHSTSGETLTETLVSILIISIVSVTLATMIRTASRVNEIARDYDQDLDQAVSSLNRETGETMTICLSINNEEQPVEYSVNVRAGLNEDNKNPYNLYAYTYSPD